MIAIFFLPILYAYSFITYLFGMIFLFSEQATYTYVKMWCRGVIRLMRIFGVSTEVLGKEIPKGSGIFCCNHQSYFEIIVMFATLDKAIFIMKKSIMNIPIFSFYCKRLGMIAIDRSKFNKNWMDQAKTALEKGKQVVIFPEGTRVPIGRSISYKKGAFKLAEMMNMKITPVKTNSGECWKGPGFISKGKVYVEFFDAIDPNPEKLREIIG